MMSLQHAFQLFDQHIFESGPYLRAFDALTDIDTHEHSILTHIGSLLPLGKGVINVPVSTSIPEIFRATKMSVSTVRRKLKALEGKGYLIVRPVFFTNASGKVQQGANEYLLTTKAFDAYFGMFPVVGSSAEKPAGGRSSDSPIELLQEGNRTCEQEVAIVVSHWENVTGLAVSPSEREEFAGKFMTLAQPASHFLDKIDRISDDPQALRIARNINVLCLPREVTGDRGLGNILQPDIAQHLHQKASGRELPKDDRDLLFAINTRLATEISEVSRQRLEILRETVSRCNFAISLKLYQRHFLEASTARLC
jgi:hypothetical protein